MECDVHITQKKYIFKNRKTRKLKMFCNQNILFYFSEINAYPLNNYEQKHSKTSKITFQKSSIQKHYESDCTGSWLQLPIE